MEIFVQMFSFGFEGRDCKHGGTFDRGERMNATEKGWFCDACASEDDPLESTLAAARAVIAAFVYPHAPMTPAQREAWEAWENITGESHAT